MDSDSKAPECVDLTKNHEIQLGCIIMLGIIFCATLFSHFRYGTPWFALFGVLLALADLVITYLFVCSRWGSAQFICILWLSTIGLTCIINSRGLVLFIRALRRQEWFESRCCFAWFPLWFFSLSDLSVLLILVSNSFGFSCFQQSISSKDEASLMFRSGMSKSLIENLIKAGLLIWLWQRAKNDVSVTFLVACGMTCLDLLHGMFLIWCSDVCCNPIPSSRNSSLFEDPTNSSLQKNLHRGDILDSSQQADGIPRTFTFTSRISARSTESFVRDDFYVVDGEEAQVVGVTDTTVRFRLLTNGRLLSVEAADLSEEVGRVRTFSRNSSMDVAKNAGYSIREYAALSNDSLEPTGRYSNRSNRY